MSGRKRWTHLDQMVGEGRVALPVRIDGASQGQAHVAHDLVDPLNFVLEVSTEPDCFSKLVDVDRIDE